MKLELKNIKHTAWASEETHCYQASLYVDGKPVAIVSNDGHGAADRDYPHPKFKGMEQCLEFWCCDQVNDWLSARELKSKLKKEFLFQFADKVGVFAHKTRPSRAHKATILNDLPFDEALSIWKETSNA
jgi:hypothetical protein